jgi:hypothetical protein
MSWASEAAHVFNEAMDREGKRRMASRPHVTREILQKNCNFPWQFAPPLLICRNGAKHSLFFADKLQNQMSVGFFAAHSEKINAM